MRSGSSARTSPRMTRAASRHREPRGRPADRAGTQEPLALVVADKKPLHEAERLGPAPPVPEIGYVAVPYQVYKLTGSTAVVGLLALVALVPLLLSAIVGGAFADAVDRRRMVRYTELGLAVLSGVLLVNALLPHPQLWVLFVVEALAASLGGF